MISISKLTHVVCFWAAHAHKAHLSTLFQVEFVSGHRYSYGLGLIIYLVKHLSSYVRLMMLC